MIIEKDGKQLPYIIISKPIKNAYFRVKNNQIVVTKGPRIPLQVIEKRLDDYFDHFYKLIEGKKVDDQQIALFGQHYDLEWVIGHPFNYEVKDTIRIWIPNQELKEKALQTFYGQQLKNLLDSLDSWLVEALKPFNLSPLPTKIKYLKSKFGSCHTRKKEITMNAYLAKLEPIYTKYVLLHEYAHLIVPNHQKPFYDVLDLMMPGHKTIQKALRKHHI
ncbi:M48 family metallopeptidase [Acholeplasma vituli]|uniref:M48 family metallopeptidase n=1 Tax=Paracholeplasma vituli TaxID=69473 RepID=A0ABT2PWQ2_9MOLU|nr:M48 family metallopeptidase [Paracholeplasma vituli]MCU0105385.1 M48 family metallopeptidase [Paracholeplasma vituli]